MKILGKGGNHKKKLVALLIAAIMISTALFAAYELYPNRNSQHSLETGPYVSVQAYGIINNTTRELNNNLSLTVSSWVPSVSGMGTSENLYSGGVRWNQVISIGNNFSMIDRTWKDFIGKDSGSLVSLSLIFTYFVIRNGSIMDYEYYTNLLYNPFSSGLFDKVFINNFTMNLDNPFSVIPVTNGPESRLASYSSNAAISDDTEYTTIAWKNTLAYTGWYPIYLVNTSVEPSNEEALFAWTAASFSAKMEFGGAASTGSNFLSSADPTTQTGTLTFSTTTDAIAGNSGYYDGMFLPSTTITWKFGTEYFFESINGIIYLKGTASVSNIAVSYSGATSIKVGGIIYNPNAQVSSTTTDNWEDATFLEEYARAMAYAFSNKYTSQSYQISIPAGERVTISDFDIYQSTNFQNIENTIQDEGAIAMGIATAGLILMVLAAAASAFPGGSTASNIAEMGTIASIGGWVDSIVNLASSFTLITYTDGNLQTMTVTNQIVNFADIAYAIDVTAFNTGGGDEFSTSSGNIAFIANTPYIKVT